MIHVNSFLTNLAAMSQHIFQGTAATAAHTAQLIAVIEVVWFVWQTLINKRSVEELVNTFAQKILGLVFLLSMIYWVSDTGGSYIVNVIAHDFGGAGQAIGQMAGGGSVGTTPDDFIGLGFNKAMELLGDAIAPLAAIGAALLGLTTTTTASAAGAITAGCPFVTGTGTCGPSIAAAAGVAAAHTDALSGIGIATFALFGVIVATLLACLGVLFAFVRLAIKLLMVTIETYLVLAAASVLLAFSTSSWTKSIAAPYPKYVIQLALRTFAIYLVAGISAGLINSLSLSISFDLNIANMLTAPLQQIMNIFIVAAIVNVLVASPDQIANVLQGYLQSPGLSAQGLAQAIGGMASNAIMSSAGAHTAALGGASGGSGANGGGNAAAASRYASSTSAERGMGSAAGGSGTISPPPATGGTSASAPGASGGSSHATPAVPQTSGLHRLENMGAAALHAGMQNAFGADPFDASSPNGGGSSDSSAGGGASGGGEIGAHAAREAAFVRGALSDSPPSGASTDSSSSSSAAGGIMQHAAREANFVRNLLSDDPSGQQSDAPSSPSYYNASGQFGPNAAASASVTPPPPPAKTP